MDEKGKGAWTSMVKPGYFFTMCNIRLGKDRHWEPHSYIHMYVYTRIHAQMKEVREGFRRSSLVDLTPDE